MLLAVRTARFLLLSLLVAVTLSMAAYLVQGSEECNLVVSERKVMRTIENKIRARKIVSDDYNFMKMELMKENGERYSRKLQMLMPRENYRARFVAFNADYKGPRHHPPKNN